MEYSCVTLTEAYETDTKNQDPFGKEFPQPLQFMSKSASQAAISLISIVFILRGSEILRGNVVRRLKEDAKYIQGIVYPAYNLLGIPSLLYASYDNLKMLKRRLQVAMDTPIFKIILKPEVLSIYVPLF